MLNHEHMAEKNNLLVDVSVTNKFWWISLKRKTLWIICFKFN